MGDYDIDINSYKCYDCGLYYQGYDANQHGKGKCVGPWEDK